MKPQCHYRISHKRDRHPNLCHQYPNTNTSAPRQTPPFLASKFCINPPYQDYQNAKQIYSLYWIEK